MRDKLPGIQIKIAEAQSIFMEQMRQIALQTQKFQVNYHKDFLGHGFDILSVSPESHARHSGLFGQFITTPDKPSVIRVEMRAERWKPEPPTYKDYVESAKEIVYPLLQSYNSQFNTKYSLSIESSESLKPKLPPKANQRFQEFVTLANKQILHPLDWERFYIFIYNCSSRSIKTTQEDIKELLLSSGFSEEDSEELANIFGHGVSLLRLGKR